MIGRLLSFLTGIARHLHELNVELRGKLRLVTKLVDKSPTTKFALFVPSYVCGKISLVEVILKLSTVFTDYRQVRLRPMATVLLG